MSDVGRPRLLSAILPVLLVFAVYVFGWLRPGLRDMAIAEAHVVEARAAAPSIETVEVERRRTVELRESLEAARSASAACARDGAPPEVSPDASRALTALLRRHALVLEREAPAGSGDGSLLPPAWRTSAGAADRLRTVDLTGRFPDVLAALRAMQAPEARVLPLRLTMRRAKAAGTPPSWTVTLWI